MANEPSDTAKTAVRKGLARFAHESGLQALYTAPRDTKLLCLQRFTRLFAYGGSTLILAAYLADLGFSDSLIGLFMTLTLVGDVVISFLLTLVADRLGRRNILALGSCLMAGSGVVFSATSNYYGLLAASIFGVITPSGNEIGPFRAIEESAIAHLTSPEDRGHIFAWYTLTGYGGTALGVIICGWVISVLVDRRHWTEVEAYRAMFIAYAVLGLVKLLLTVCLSERCEADKPAKPDSAAETAPLLEDRETTEVDAAPKPKPAKPRSSLLPEISAETRTLVVGLSLLFALDSFASGLAPMSWLTYYFKRRFHVSDGQLGTLFSATSAVQAVSVLVAASIARRIGNVRAMVFTHLPSAICLALIGFPSSLALATTLLVLRASSQSMDTAPRSAFLAAIILPNERTAVMGMINVVKTASQSLGPYITGLLFSRGLFWVSFLLAGCLKATYDIGMLLAFAGRKRKDEQQGEGAAS